MSQAATPLSVRVAHKQAEADGICSLVLESLSGEPLPGFSAGAHLDIHLPNDLVRQYSLCNAPTGDAPAASYHIAVLRDPASRGGSLAVHERVQVGDTLRISAPKNHFPLSTTAPHHLLLAGGIGVTPMLAMVEQLAAQGGSFELHYSSRSPQRTAFVARLAQAPYTARVHHHYDDGAAAQKLDLNALLTQAPAGSHLYVCGPQGYMDAVLGGARTLGWAEDRLHHEFFGAAPAAASGDGPFQLELARSARVITVAADQTALQALLAAGVDVPLSCEQGVCGTCLTTVLAGTPDHRDHYLTPDEQTANDQFLPCCSRSRSPKLVLDL